jgi:hypothetical protein
MWKKKPYLTFTYSRAVARYSVGMYTRAIALMSIMLATHCSEWIPASSAEAIAQERVRVQRRVSLEEPESMQAEHGVVTSELAYPSRRTLQRLRRDGAYFEVRHSNADKIVLPVALAIVGVAVCRRLERPRPDVQTIVTRATRQTRSSRRIRMIRPCRGGRRRSRRTDAIRLATVHVCYGR